MAKMRLPKGIKLNPKFQALWDEAQNNPNWDREHYEHMKIALPDRPRPSSEEAPSQGLVARALRIAVLSVGVIVLLVLVVRLAIQTFFA